MEDDSMVLSIIDKLRQRKARPDRLKIVKHLMRTGRYSSQEQASAVLQDCVSRKRAIEVLYKGSTSYRNAEKAKAKAPRRRKQSLPVESRPTISDLSTCANDSNEVLSNSPKEVPGDLDRQSCFKEQESHEKSDDSEGKIESTEKQKDEMCSSSTNVSALIREANHFNNVIQERPPSKRMRIKKTHGPDFETIHPTKKQRCGKRKEKQANVSRPQEALQVNASSVHSDSCSSIDSSSSSYSRPTVNGMTAYPTPSASSPSEEEESCSPPAKKICHESFLQMKFKPITTEVKYNENNYPDSRSWSVEQVADFFRQAGFEKHAQVFLDKEIDGSALMLLHREDVLTKLDLKLGPALKICEHINKLQRFGMDLVKC